jgi:hypothetical protein
VKPNRELSIDTSIPGSLQAIFDGIVKACPRSSTNQDLHPDKQKENLLAYLLNYVVDKFGLEVAGKFQNVHEKSDPGLSFAFAQVSNAVIERTFQFGSCHSQAAYSLVELAKCKVTNASLVYSRTENTDTEHWYVLLNDKQLVSALSSSKNVFVRVEKNRFSAESIFFDPWSKQLSLWKNFKSIDSCTEAIRKTDQAAFKSFLHLFGTEQAVVERIKWCLKGYRENLLSLPGDHKTSINPGRIPKDSDEKFQQEVILLTSHQKCIDKLVMTIDLYLSEFDKILNDDNAKLLSTTVAFFKTPIQAKWTPYSAEALSKTKYKGHSVYYFTMKGSLSESAPAFFQHLTSEGFSAEMKAAEKNPSIVVDLSVSKNPTV